MLCRVVFVPSSGVVHQLASLWCLLLGPPQPSDDHPQHRWIELAGHLSIILRELQCHAMLSVTTSPPDPPTSCFAPSASVTGVAGVGAASRLCCACARELWSVEAWQMPHGQC